MPHVTGTRAQEDYGSPLIQQSDPESDIFGSAARPRVGCPLIQQSDPESDIFVSAARPRVGHLSTTTGYFPEARRGPLLHYSLQRSYPALLHDPL